MSTSDVYLNVPVLNQWEVFPQVPKHNNMACWYTSALMVLLYRMGVAGSLNMLQIETLKRLWINRGLASSEDATLAEETGLEHSPTSVLVPQRKAAEYCKALRHLGPLVFSEPTHVIVVRGCTLGVDDEPVITVNDPWGGRVVAYSLDEFIARISWSYPIHFRRTRYDPPSVFKAGPNMYPYESKY